MVIDLMRKELIAQVSWWAFGRLSSSFTCTIVLEMFTTMADNYFIGDTRVVCKINPYKFRVRFFTTIFDVCFNINFLAIVIIDILAHQFSVNTCLMPFSSGYFPTSFIFKLVIRLCRIGMQ